MTENGNKKAASTNRNKRHKFISEYGYRDLKGPFNLKDHLIEFKKQDRELRRALRSKAREIREERNQKNIDRGIDVMNWDELELITFDPETEMHSRHVKILSFPPQNGKRKKLVTRLETEFCRLYTRYRRAAERKLGRASGYEVMPSEKKYAARSAILCINKGVTPRQVLEYWHKHIKNFRTASSMVIPSLSFLSGPANIDTVACSVIGDDKIGVDRKTNEPLTKPRAGNSFSDVSGLDVRIRPALKKAGFEIDEYDDRFLLTVQKNALALAAGRDIFIGKGLIRSMSKWIAKNIYSVKDEN